MIVYQLASQKHAESNLINKRLKLSRIKDLNDPFELLGAELANKKLRNAFQIMRDKIDKENGIICFSKSWQNPVLWAHYGERHYGVCLGFEVPDDFLSEVKYVSSRKLVEIDKLSGKSSLDLSSMHLLLNQKYKDWQYEEEFRGWVKLKNAFEDSGMHFVKFSENLALKQVIIGPRNIRNTDYYNRLINKDLKDVEIFKSRLAFKTYSVVKNNRFKSLKT